MKRINSKSFILTNIFSVVIFLNIFYLDTYSQEKSASNFNPISSQEAVKNMSPGWNLANTLEAIPTEGSWNNPPAEEYIFDDIKKAGFRSVRIPVTWYTHFGPAPDYKVDPKWMDRVEQVVDWALKRDLYVMIDVHFDSEWVSRMVIDPATGNYVNNYGNSIVKLEKLWGQIAERFKWKNEKLLLEVLNEPIDGNEPIKGDKVEDKFGKPKSPNNPEARYDLTQEQVNDMNRRVVSLIRKSGGYNDKRLVVIPGIASNVNPVEQILKSFKAPDDKYIIFTSHYYLPWEFTNNQCGRTSWGTFEEKQAV